MKQTAVEWLIEKMLDGGIGICKEWREQAKEMEYKQSMDAMQKGMELQEKENNRVGFRERNGLLSSQTEISDEEIKKWAKEYTCKEYERLIFDYENYDTYNDFINGAKKYREQLKLK